MSSAEVILRAARVLREKPPEIRFGQVDTRIAGGAIAEVSADLYEGDAEILDPSGCRNIQRVFDVHHHVLPAALRGHLVDESREESDALICDLVPDAVGPANGYTGTYGDAMVMLDAGTTCTLDHTRDRVMGEIKASNAQLTAAIATCEVGVHA